MRWPKWFRRGVEKTTRTRPFDEDALPEPVAPTLEQSVEEGMLLAEYATRMAVKNHIVVDTIQYGNSYDPVMHSMEAAAMLADRRLQRPYAARAGRPSRRPARLTDAPAFHQGRGVG